jgi:hypothetical protein
MNEVGSKTFTETTAAVFAQSLSSAMHNYE